MLIIIRKLFEQNKVSYLLLSDTSEFEADSSEMTPISWAKMRVLTVENNKHICCVGPCRKYDYSITSRLLGNE